MRPKPLNSGGTFDIDIKKKKLQELILSSENPDVWNKPGELQKINKEKTLNERAIEAWETLHSRTQDSLVLLEMAVEEKDDSSFREVQDEVKRLEALVHELEIKKMLAAELDSNSTYLSINAGAGGTESQDWASILMRMYLRYAESHGYKAEVMEMTDGEIFGLHARHPHPHPGRGAGACGRSAARGHRPEGRDALEITDAVRNKIAGACRNHCPRQTGIKPVKTT